MKHRKKSAVLLSLFCLSQLWSLGSVRGATSTSNARTDWWTALDSTSNYYSGDLPVGGPSGTGNIWSSVWLSLNLPVGGVLTSDSLTFDIEQTINVGVTFTLSIWQLPPGYTWGPTTTRADIAAQPHISVGTVTVTSGLLASDGDNSITFSDGALLTLGNSGRLSEPFYWSVNDMQALFPQGATAFSGFTTTPPVNVATYTVSGVPEPSSTAAFVVGVIGLFFVIPRVRRTVAPNHALQRTGTGV